MGLKKMRKILTLRMLSGDCNFGKISLMIADIASCCFLSYIVYQYMAYSMQFTYSGV